jgi:hypothetical protein
MSNDHQDHEGGGAEAESSVDLTSNSLAAPAVMHQVGMQEVLDPVISASAATSVLLNPHQASGKHLQVFDFPNPFAENISPNFNLQRLSAPVIIDQRSESTVDNIQELGQRKIQAISFSGLTAANLVAKLSEDIPGFKFANVWTAEDVSGVAILSAIAPSKFPNFLDTSLGISSGFMQSRIFSVIVQLMRRDPSLEGRVYNAWSDAREFFMEHISGGRHVSQLGNPSCDCPHTPLDSKCLFPTPAPGKGVAKTNKLIEAYTPKTPAFMAQIAQRSSFMDESNLFHDPSVLDESRRVSNSRVDDEDIRLQSPAFGANLSSISGGQRFEFTIRQPGVLPKYEVLENAKDPTQLYIWLRKYRRESLLAEAADRKAIRQLMSQDAKLEIVRVMNKVRKEEPGSTLFDAQNPFPKTWAGVTDTLVLRVLFRLNGPVNVDEARARLKERPFFFPDATTDQSKFLPKFRTFCNSYVDMIRDFEYNWESWPATQELTPRMIKDAFLECFSNTETTLGPDGKTMVPKSSNLAEIRSKIKDYKDLTLEDIIERICQVFEERDIAVRANKTSYPVIPWRAKEAKAKKRQFNQMSGASAAGPAPKRPPTGFPRCNNCGSKGHLCSERTCFFWGHKDAKGPHGVWPEGTKSLDLPKEDFKAWKAVRSDIFYSYPENQKKNKS